ncbi:MAG: hypothetical protein UX53_C0025G0003 [Candidatus Azambacteria bacterium GW2011_GWB2_46_37]|uniref:Uncharacterized protein n=9 Tax=Candidatus Azamiibacteriota TaxID=1752741 RepID=A0A1F5C674_9BACT|nr:MAG: hypothetical protein UX27_C0025G0007 [Candidatus Azambacteria bacterium GW2011_GWA2_45_90]KKU20828.1 MAG: hypothetical protein UX33_C0036G0006 [Candidatus Azambacteria bacterium GW2011_GWC1_46_13]KKU35172.1 MAG: hypothetical protein UX48_C0018G0003 [Candidatus Azambacteria bacterium GW2011_GWB1_46_27]KKU38799.1 MAG: hypothetical protein UX53_C0025G0003 [Candidatus Azambacteria bacterium GW2011_GWB2_46_37]KKU39533.1 MAG: hypothetical protein UX55_C0034G0003 [Candidatus Azambacteria bacte
MRREKDKRRHGFHSRNKTTKQGFSVLRQIRIQSKKKGDTREKKGRQALEELEQDGLITRVHFSKKWDDWDRQGIDAMVYALNGDKIPIDFKSSRAGVNEHLEKGKEMGERATIPILVKTDEALEEFKQRIIKELKLLEKF